MSDPIHLTTAPKAAIDPNSAATTPIQLRNTTTEAIEITAFKWTARLSTANTSKLLSGGTVGCQLMFNQTPLTNGAVPIWNFGPSLNELAAYYPAVSFRWPLDRPMLLLPGEGIEVNLFHRGFTSLPIYVAIGVEAYVAPTVGASRFVPYVGSYISKVFQTDGTASDASNEVDLKNSSNVPLKITRLINRVAGVYNSTGENFDMSDPAFEGIYETMRIVDSKGRALVKSFTPVATIFDRMTRSLEAGGYELAPGDYLQVLINKLQPPGIINLIFFQNHFSMVGYREVPL